MPLWLKIAFLIAALVILSLPIIGTELDRKMLKRCMGKYREEEKK